MAKSRTKKSVAIPSKETAVKQAIAKKESSPAARPRGKLRPPIDLAQAVLQAAATNERINQLLLEHVDDASWNAPPPQGKGRTIAAIVSHMHNVRHMWLTVSAKDLPIPEKLDRHDVTRVQAMKSLEKSQDAMDKLFARALENGGHVKEFRPDVVSFLSYFVAHEAHHRGQICLMLRGLGKPLPHEVSFGMWDWSKRWKECGFGE